MWIDYLWIWILSTLPLVESRLAIPFGLITYDLHPVVTLLTTVFFNALATALALRLLPFVEKFFRKKWRWCDRFLEKLFQKTHTNHSKSVKIWGNIFLVLFVSVPLPGSGGWTAALVAYVFGFPFWRSVWLISLGLFIAGLLVTLITLGGVEIFGQKVVSVFALVA